MESIHRKHLAEINGKFVYCDPSKPKSKAEKEIEKTHRQAVENIRRTVEVIQSYERRLGAERWVRGSEQWIKHEEMLHNRRYQRCLDNLERLVVSRMFELTKMNMSGTGACSSLPCIQSHPTMLTTSARIQNAKAYCEGNSNEIPRDTHRT